MAELGKESFEWSRREFLTRSGGIAAAAVVASWLPPTAAGAAPVGSAVNAPALSGDLVLTPGGYRDRSLVHLIQPGDSISHLGGRLQKVDKLGNVVADFGALPTRPPGLPLMPRNVSRPAKVSPSLGSGWIAYADWSNTTGQPISYFATTWTVPPAPQTNSGQTIFLFNGIQNSTMILQPVLQWGPSGAGGAAYWAVASWYVDGSGGPGTHTTLVPVSPGQLLVGVMSLTGTSQNGFSYSCQFQGIANTQLAISNAVQLTWCAETLEAYGLQSLSDYPAALTTPFASIEIRTGNVHPSVAWTAVDAVGTGPTALVLSNANPSGDVEILYNLGPFQVRSLETPTTFGNETDGTWFMADWDRDGIPDLVLIKTANTASGHVEVHIASGKSNYQTRILETSTTFGNETDGTWFMADWDRDGIPDLVLIKTANCVRRRRGPYRGGRIVSRPVILPRKL
jgi:hypothetical protein